ncbi:H-2 class II histocompatibility antigen, E-S beta chain-like [Crotalus tigris]|uniref:H-2 class II histocompatibility antigen, E-S beta chain-like n=1 Tax=Crotalus tigris TaxID=88082 RepID=UPI00192F7C9A|nr:H-2 class II histocompatibility antigen, E-S beta chain-like [Crotalus tigris]
MAQQLECIGGKRFLPPSQTPRFRLWGWEPPRLSPRSLGALVGRRPWAPLGSLFCCWRGRWPGSPEAKGGRRRPPYGTRRVRFLERLFYDRQELVRFDSARGEFEAVTALGKATAEAWNRDERLLHAFCRYNYEALQGGPVIGRRAKPTVSISPTKLDPASPNTILLCIARGFYPVEIEVQWLTNGRPEEEGVAFGEELQNGDWTYQLHVLLETQPQRGDVYTCQVEHASLEAPITVPWEPRSSNSARSKLWTGIVAAVIGVIFFAMGLFLYMKSKKSLMN